MQIHCCIQEGHLGKNGTVKCQAYTYSQAQAPLRQISGFYLTRDMKWHGRIARIQAIITSHGEGMIQCFAFMRGLQWFVDLPYITKVSFQG